MIKVPDRRIDTARFFTLLLFSSVLAFLSFGRWALAAVLLSHFHLVLVLIELSVIHELVGVLVRFPAVLHWVVLLVSCARVHTCIWKDQVKEVFDLEIKQQDVILLNVEEELKASVLSLFDPADNGRNQHCDEEYACNGHYDRNLRLYSHCQGVILCLCLVLIGDHLANLSHIALRWLYKIVDRPLIISGSVVWWRGLYSHNTDVTLKATQRPAT